MQLINQVKETYTSITVDSKELQCLKEALEYYQTHGEGKANDPILCALAQCCLVISEDGGS